MQKTFKCESCDKEITRGKDKYIITRKGKVCSDSCSSVMRNDTCICYLVGVDMCPAHS